MGVLREEVERFLNTINFGHGDGYGSGNGYGSGYGDGKGFGFGYGYGNGCGYGYGDGSGDGSGDSDGYGSSYGFGHGFGSGDGDGYGYGNGCGYGFGSGYGNGCGYGDSDGDGSGDGDGVKSINGHTVYNVDNTPTVFTAIHGDCAVGYILQDSLLLTPCYIVRGNGCFAHGDTLRQAWADLQEKVLDDSPVEDRLDRFKDEHPDYDLAYPAADLFLWHHILTGSCKAGREAFCRDHGIDITTDTFTVHQFIALTEESYGGDIIKQLKQ